MQQPQNQNFNADNRNNVNGQGGYYAQPSPQGGNYQGHAPGAGYPYPMYRPVYVPVYIQPPLPEHYEKAAVKKTAGRIGLGMLFLPAISFIFGIIIAVFSRVFYRANIDISNSAIQLLLNIVITVLGFGSAAVFILSAEKPVLGRDFGFNRPKRENFVPAVMTGLGFCYVANVSVSLLQNSFSWLFPFKQQDVELPIGPWGFLLSVLAVAVIPALIEEFMFRGAVMGSLLKFSKPFAIFTSAALFGLMHGNLVQIPFAFMVGSVIAFADLETGSFWTGVVIHFLNNFLSVILDYAQMHFGENITNTVFYFLTAVVIMLGFFGMYLMCRNNPNILQYENTPHKSSLVTRFGWFMGSAAIIVFLVITLAEIVAVQVTF